MRILVTGGAGFIGSHVAQKLANRGDYVVIADDLNDYYDVNLKKYNLDLAKASAFYKEDIRNKEQIEKIFRKEKIEKVIHLAARAGVRPSILNPKLYQEVNVNGTLNLLRLARKFKIKNFVFASSSSVYGNNKRVPFSESDDINPISPYASTKKDGELMCSTYNDLCNMPITCLRFFTVYGPRGRPDMAISKFIRSIYHGREIEVYGYGKMSRDFTYIDDIVDGVIKSADNERKFEIINLGNSNPVNQMNLISLIEKGLGKKAKIKELPMQEGDVNTTYANIIKAKKILNWQPKTSIEEGIEKTIAWFYQNTKFLLI